MSQVSITINEKLYHIACDDGQEAHLIRLGNYLNQRAKELIASVGDVNESLLLVMLSLLMADELSEAFEELKSAQPSTSCNSKTFSPSENTKDIQRIKNLIRVIKTLSTDLKS